MNKDEMKEIFSKGIDGLNEKTYKDFVIVVLKREMNKILKALHNGLKDIQPLIEAFDKDPCCITFSDVYNSARLLGITLFGESTIAQTRAEYMLHGLEEVVDDISEDKNDTKRMFRQIEVDDKDDKVVIGPEMNKEEFDQYLVNLILNKKEEKKEAAKNPLTELLKKCKEAEKNNVNFTKED